MEAMSIAQMAQNRARGRKKIRTAKSSAVVCAAAWVSSSKWRLVAAMQSFPRMSSRRAWSAWSAWGCLGLLGLLSAACRGLFDVASRRSCAKADKERPRLRCLGKVGGGGTGGTPIAYLPDQS
jgi:hypothetical protein